MKPLAYLALRQFRGAVVNMLRSGARTLVALLGVAWFMLQITNAARLASGGASPISAVDLPYEVLRGILMFLMLGGAYAVVTRGLGGEIVTFSAADIDFLFSMPLPQPVVLGFRILLDAGRQLTTILFMSLWLSPVASRLLHVPMGALLARAVPALFFFFFFLTTGSHALYLFYAYQVRVVERLHAVARAGGIAVLLAAVASISRDVAQGHSAIDQLARAMSHPVVRILLFPLSLTADTILSARPSLPQVAAGNLLMLAGLALGSVSAALGQRQNAYEPSLAVSVRKGRLRDALRSGGFDAYRTELKRERLQSRPGRPAGIVVPSIGTGWRAILWKKMQIAGRSPWFTLSVLILVGPGVPLILNVYLKGSQDRSFAAFLPALWLYLMWFISLTVMQSVRADLAQGEILKMLPVPPRKIVLALVALPVIQATLTLWSGLAGCALLFRDQPQPYLVPIGILAPLFVGTVALFHALLGIMFPRQRDPTHRLLSGLLMLPGWGLLVMAPVGIGVAMTAISRSGPTSGLESALPMPAIVGLAIYFLGAGALLLYWGAGAMRAYSPADD